MADTPREVNLTRYLIYKTEDEGVTLNLVGAELSTSSDDARRLFFARDENAKAEGHFTAISVNAARIKPRVIERTVKAKEGEPIEVQIPGAPAEASAPEEQDSELESAVVLNVPGADELDAEGAAVLDARGSA